MKYKIKDIAQQISVRENNPASSSYERFVGLEHYESGEIEISKWGSTEKLDSAMKVFEEGDILIARRNVFLRRASIVWFEGLTSGDSIVLRAYEEKYQKLLPFVLNTEDFWNYADQNSDGTMSKRLSPKVLLEYEFDLPEDKEMDKLAELLWSIYETKKQYKNVILATDELINSRFIELFGSPVDNPMNWPTKGLMDLGNCKNGMNFSASDQGVSIQSVGVGDIKDYDILNDMDSLTTLSLNEMPKDEYLLHDGDLVFVRSNGNKSLVGRCVAIYPGKTPVTFSGFCIRFRKESEIVMLEYLLRFLKMPEIRNQMAGRGANIQNLNQKILAELQVPVPPMQLQEQYVEFTQQCNNSKVELQNAMDSAAIMIKTLSKQSFNKEE